MIDSSPQIMRLEELVPGRSLVPTDPVVAFLDHLLEDYGDEWVTKQMFHYRWWYPDARGQGRARSSRSTSTSRCRPSSSSGRRPTSPTANRVAWRWSAAPRPTGRSSRRSYERLLDLFEAHLATTAVPPRPRPGPRRLRHLRPAQPARRLGPRVGPGGRRPGATGGPLGRP